MAATITLSGDWLQNIGSINQTTGTLTLGTYATGGVSVTPAMLGLGSFVGSPQFTAAGYIFSYDSTNQKVLAYRSAGFTPAGTVAAPTFTGTAGTKPTFTVTKGAILASSELGLSADATSATVNNNAIAATLELLAANSPVGATTPAGTNSAPAFTGTAVAAGALVEVANAVNLAAVTVAFVAQGR